MTEVLNTTLARISTIFILLCLLLIAAYPVWAEDSTSTAATKRDVRKEKVQQRIETRKEIVATRIDTMRDKMASREAALKSKLEAFRNKQKAAIADRVNTNLNMINQNQTAQMLKHLETMTSILNKLENRVNQNTPDIKDPTLAREAIANSRVAIASASAAVTAQAQKDYTIQVTSEGRIRQDAQKQREALHKDLLSVRKIVIEAKKSVSNAIRSAKSGRMEKEATKSGQ